MGENNHYVYILKCKDETLYTGYTTDIKRRIEMHENGKGAKYTRGRAPFQLKFQKCCASKSEALQLEASIKKLSKRNKMLLIKEKQLEGYGADENTKELSE